MLTNTTPKDLNQHIDAPTIEESIFSVEKMENHLSKRSRVCEEDMIALSVQGSLFVLKKQFVLSRNWMIAKILTSDIPFAHYNEQIYLDIDPVSFRIILSILQGITSLKMVTPKISFMELSLLISTARYLLCFDILEELEHIQSTNANEINILQKEKQDLTKQLDDLQTMISVIETTPIQVMHCNGYMKGYPFKTCACISLLIGPAKIDGGDLKCSDCDSVVIERKPYRGIPPSKYLYSVTRASNLKEAISQLN